MPRHAIPHAVILLIVATLLTGCGHTPPTFEVVGARLADRTPEGVVLEFDLDATNTNAEELPLRVASYTLSIDGERVFTGERSPEATLRRFGTQRITLPAAIRVDDPGAADALTTGRHRYRLNGTVTYLAPGVLFDVLFDARIYRPSISFSDTGEIDFDAPSDAPLEPSLIE